MTDIAVRPRIPRRAPGRLALPGFPSLDSGLGLLGLLVIVAFCVVAGGLGFITYRPYGLARAVGIAFGAAAIVAMAQTLILAARPRLLEPVFGGLDRMYRVHKWLGISALALMILHDQFEPDFKRVVRETALGDFADDAGEFAFNALLALIALSWFRRLPFTPLEIPYQIWRFSHRFMGALFTVVVFHQFFVDMPTGVDPALSVMLNGFGLAGVIAWTYTEFVAPRLRRRAYAVSGLSRRGTITSVTLIPKGRAMRWRPGQFAFLRAPDAGLPEPHPFTIASAPRPDGALTLSIKGLGGWTRSVPDALRVGAPVQVEGPYGRFDFRKGGTHQIWLAGGIGITPFLAWAESLTEAERRTICLVYTVRTEDEAIGLETLRAAAARNPRFGYHLVATARDGRLTAAHLTGMAPFAVRDADLWFCGPTGLKDGILKGLAELGQTPRRVRFEHFEFA